MDTVTPALKVVKMNIAATGAISGASVRTIGSTLYTGITLTDSATTFEVSEDCNALRIKNNIMHWNINAAGGSPNYVLDTVTFPTGVTALANVAFSGDFTIAVSDGGVYAYTAPAAGAATGGSYALLKADTFAATKVVLKTGNFIRGSLVILAYAETATPGKYAYKLQINSLSKSSTGVNTLTKID